MMNIIEALGYIVMIGIIIGVIGTAVCIAFLAVRGGLEEEEEEQRESGEFDRWNQK